MVIPVQIVDVLLLGSWGLRDPYKGNTSWQGCLILSPPHSVTLRQMVCHPILWLANAQKSMLKWRRIHTLLLFHEGSSSLFQAVKHVSLSFFGPYHMSLWVCSSMRNPLGLCSSVTIRSVFLNFLFSFIRYFGDKLEEVFRVAIGDIISKSILSILTFI